MDIVQNIAVDALVASPLNPRKSIDPAALAALADSIREVGILQPIVVRQPPGRSRKRWEIVCGHRRVEAARLAGLAEVPAVVRKMADREAVIAALVENSHRSEVSPLEESDAIVALLGQSDDPAAVQAELAARLGRPPRWVRDRVRLGQLVPELRARLTAGTIPLGGALVLSVLPVSRQVELEARIAGETWRSGWSVGDLVSMARRYDRRLSAARWALDDATYSPRACTACPLRTHVQGDLFGDDVDDDTCLDDPCWRAKLAEWGQRQAALGATVQVPKETAASPQNAINLDSRCLSAPPNPDGTFPTYGELLADLPVAASTVVIQPRGAAEVYVAESAILEALPEGHPVRTALEQRAPRTSPAPSGPSPKARKDALQLKFAAFDHVPAPRDVQPKVREALFRAAASAVAEDTRRFVAQRRGGKLDKDKPALERLVELAPDGDTQWRMTLELLIANSGFMYGDGRTELLEAVVAVGDQVAEAQDAVAAADDDAPDPRCVVCHAPLAGSREFGCVEDDCAFRPNARGDAR